MTCALGIVHGGTVWLAADSATTSSDMVSDVATEPKAWARPAWVFASAGSWRLGQKLRHELRPNPNPRDPDRYVAVELPKAIRRILTDEPAEQDGCFLLAGHAGRLWEIDLADCAATRSAWGYAAIGVPEALIGLALTAGEPERRLRRILTMVSRHQANVRPPFTVVRV